MFTYDIGVIRLDGLNKAEIANTLSKIFNKDVARLYAGPRYPQPTTVKLGIQLEFPGDKEKTPLCYMQYGLGAHKMEAYNCVTGWLDMEFTGNVFEKFKFLEEASRGEKYKLEFTNPNFDISDIYATGFLWYINSTRKRTREELDICINAFCDYLQHKKGEDARLIHKGLHLAKIRRDDEEYGNSIAPNIEGVLLKARGFPLKSDTVYGRVFTPSEKNYLEWLSEFKADDIDQNRIKNKPVIELIEKLGLSTIVSNTVAFSNVFKKNKKEDLSLEF